MPQVRATFVYYQPSIGDILELLQGFESSLQLQGLAATSCSCDDDNLVTQFDVKFVKYRMIRFTFLLY